MTAVGEMVRLEGLAFTNGAGLLDDSEYRLLCSNLYLQDVANSQRQKQMLCRACKFIEPLDHDCVELQLHLCRRPHGTFTNP